MNPSLPPDSQLWNGTLHGQFTRTAEQHPQRLAVKDRGGDWTYQQLAEHSDAWGRAFIHQIGGPAGCVVLMLPKGRELLAAMLGVLKAGGYFVCVEEGSPPGHWRALMNDTMTPVVCAERKDGLEFAGIIITQEVVRQHGAAAVEFPQRGGGDRCFMIRTSGTTGKPAAVLVTHRSWLQTVARHGRFLALTPGDKFGWLASPWTSAGLSSPFAAMLHGCSTHPFDVRQEGLDGMIRFVRDSAISILHTTPTLFRALMGQLGKDEKLSSVRVVRLGGESAYASDFELFLCHFGSQAVFLNGYGSSEAGYVSCHQVPRTNRPSPGPLPVGMVYAGHQVRISDEDGREVPHGQTGEIVVRSRWLPEGYHNGGDRREASFRAVPNEPDVRDYWTGDLGYVTAEGWLMHCGRKDDQVKVLGFRIDPTAVAEVLRSLPEVREAVVLLNQAGTLTAFVATSRSIGSLRLEVGQLLPAHQVPARWRRVPQLPLTANGKPDHQSLLALPPEPAFRVPARSLLESSLVAIWCEVLDCETVGIYDDFFAMGGTSLDTLNVLARIKQVLKRTVTPVLLMERPTIAQLAEVLDEQLRHQPQKRLVALRLEGHGPPVFFFPGGWAGENELLVFAALIPYLPQHLPIYGLLQPWMAAEAMDSASSAAWAPHVAAQISQICGDRPCILVGECIASAAAVEVARLLRDRVSSLVLLDPTEVDVNGANETSLPPSVQSYRLALRSILLRPPGPPVHLIGCQDEAGATERLLAWRMKLGASSVSRVPGDHDTYIRRFGPLTAQKLNTILRASPGWTSRTK